MSDTILKIIPTSPFFVPDDSKQSAARDSLEAAFPEAEIELSCTLNVEFVDQGANFEKVSCNLCGQQLDIDQWHEAMDAAYTTQFDNLDFMTPCCSATTSLNALRYEWPAGFSKFQLSVLNPESAPSDEVVPNLEEILGTALRVIWAHY
jgi:hypothetical protein